LTHICIVNTAGRQKVTK